MAIQPPYVNALSLSEYRWENKFAKMGNFFRWLTFLKTRNAKKTDPIKAILCVPHQVSSNAYLSCQLSVLQRREPQLVLHKRKLTETILKHNLLESSEFGSTTTMSFSSFSFTPEADESNSLASLLNSTKPGRENNFKWSQDAKWTICFST